MTDDLVQYNTIFKIVDYKSKGILKNNTQIFNLVEKCYYIHNKNYKSKEYFHNLKK